VTQSRNRIITTYAAWTVLSALRSGAPVKSRQDVYPLLRTIDFPYVLAGSSPIYPSQFDEWHRSTTATLCRLKPILCVGWAAKMVNIYLKTAVYVGELGRPGLRDAIHPPIDTGLWSGLRGRFKDDPLLHKTHIVQQIKAIRDYPTYQTIIEGCRQAAAQMNCLLIEVDQLWAPE